MNATLPEYAICCGCGAVAEEDELSYCTACNKYTCDRPVVETQCHCACKPTSADIYYRMLDTITRRFLLMRKGLGLT